MSSNIRVNSITPSVGNNVAIGTAGGTITFNCDTISGIATFANDIDITQKLDVDGHTELDNVNISGVVTATSFVGPITGNVTGNADTASNLTGSPSISVTDITSSGNVSIAGTLTYEDVINVDSIGIITARSDVSISDKIIHTGNTDTTIRFPAADTFTVETAGSERLRITGIGSVGISSAIPKTDVDISQKTGAVALPQGTSTKTNWFGTIYKKE